MEEDNSSDNGSDISLKNKNANKITKNNKNKILSDDEDEQKLDEDLENKNNMSIGAEEEQQNLTEDTNSKDDFPEIGGEMPKIDDNHSLKSDSNSEFGKQSADLKKTDDLFDAEEDSDNDKKAPVSDQSDNESNSDDNEDVLGEDSDLGMPAKHKEKKTSRKITDNDRKNLQSEIQRSERTVKVSMPKFIPKQMTLKEFLNRNKAKCPGGDESKEIHKPCEVLKDIETEVPVAAKLDRVSDWLEESEDVETLEDFPSLEEIIRPPKTPSPCKPAADEASKKPKHSYLEKIDPAVLQAKPKLDGDRVFELDVLDHVPKILAHSDDWIKQKVSKHIVRPKKLQGGQKNNIEKVTTSLNGSNKLSQLKAQLWEKMKKQREEELQKRYELHQEETGGNVEEENEDEQEEEEISDEDSSDEGSENGLEKNENEENLSEKEEEGEGEGELHLRLEGVPETLDLQPSQIAEETEETKVPTEQMDQDFVSPDFVLQLADSQIPLTQDVSMSQGLLQVDLPVGTSKNVTNLCSEPLRKQAGPLVPNTQLLQLCSGQFFNEDEEVVADNEDALSDCDSEIGERNHKKKAHIVESDDDDDQTNESKEGELVEEENLEGDENSEGVENEEGDSGDECAEGEGEIVEEDEEMVVMQQLMRVEETGIPFAKFKNKHGKMRRDFVDEEAELSGDEAGSDEDEENDSDADELLPEEGDLDILPDENTLRNQIGKVYLKQELDDDKKRILAYQNALIDDKQTSSDANLRRFRWRQAGEEEKSVHELLVEGEGSDDGQGPTDDDDFIEQKRQRAIWAMQHITEEDNDDGDNDMIDIQQETSYISKLGSIALKTSVNVQRSVSLSETLAAQCSKNVTEDDVVDFIKPLMTRRRDSLLNIVDDDTLPFPKFAPANPPSAPKAMFTRMSPKKPVKRVTGSKVAGQKAKIARVEKEDNTSVFDLIN